MFPMTTYYSPYSENKYIMVSVFDEQVFYKHFNNLLQKNVR